METQNITPQHPGRRASNNNDNGKVDPPSPPPAPYNPITEIKRQKRWEQIFDVDGSLWDVREARATKHGFDLLFGLPATSGLGRFIGPIRLIATPALVSYWHAHRTVEGAIYDLPAGRTTIKRLRSRLRLNFFTDRRDLWKKRTGDLKTLPTREFAERYGVPFHVASDWRFLLLGRATRPLDWWRHPAVLAVLRQPGVKLREIASSLHIGTTHAKRLLTKVRQLDGNPAADAVEMAGPIPTLPYERKPTKPPVKVENPFSNHRKQGEMFLGEGFWKRRRAIRTPAEKIAESTPATPKPLIRSKHSHSQLTAKRTGQLLLPFSTRRVKKEPVPMLYQMQDFEGTFYDVYEVRPTEQGFALHFGYKTRAHRRLYTDKVKPGLIATPELVAYWQAHRSEMGPNLELPAGSSTLIRLRKRLGFNLHVNNDAVWQDRLDDLKALSPREFAQKHNLPLSQVYKRRRKLLGKIRERTSSVDCPAASAPHCSGPRSNGR